MSDQKQPGEEQLKVKDRFKVTIHGQKQDWQQPTKIDGDILWREALCAMRHQEDKETGNMNWSTTTHAHLIINALVLKPKSNHNYY